MECVDLRLEEISAELQLLCTAQCTKTTTNVGVQRSEMIQTVHRLFPCAVEAQKIEHFRFQVLTLVSRLFEAAVRRSHTRF